MNLRDILLEFSRSADLYHASKIGFYEDQLKGNFITASTIHRYWKDGQRRERGEPKYDDHVWIKGISLTRSLNFAKRWGPIVYVLDQAKLTARYKFLPLKWNSPKVKRFENEEFLWMDTSKISGDGPEPVRYAEDGKVKLNNLSRYLKRIILVNKFFGPNYKTDEFYLKVKDNLEKFCKLNKIPLETPEN